MQGCYDAVTRKNTLGEPCDVCSLRFSPLPHQHVSGNMWLARCSYVERRVEINQRRRVHARNLMSTQVKRLVAPERFPAKMAEESHEVLQDEGEDYLAKYDEIYAEQLTPPYEKEAVEALAEWHAQRKSGKQDPPRSPVASCVSRSE